MNLFFLYWTFENTWFERMNEWNTRTAFDKGQQARVWQCIDTVVKIAWMAD